ncbi:hypothetical protein [Rubritalea tangerina]|uniref:hypothetical protein n=1 Tax=Rubritalea tangerina TaxID=430798 RepID=UPI00360F1AA4
MSGESLVCKDLNIPSMPTDSPLQAFYLLIFNQLCLSERACATTKSPLYALIT